MNLSDNIGLYKMGLKGGGAPRRAPVTGSVPSLEASLAAIHYHSGRGFEDKIEAIAILKSIHEECEFALPILKTI